MSWRFYVIRIGCFAWATAFTFPYRVWPAALVGWVLLGMLFALDFFLPIP